MNSNHSCFPVNHALFEYDKHAISLLLPNMLYIFPNLSLVNSLSSILCCVAKFIMYLIHVITFVKVSRNLNKLLIFHNGIQCSVSS